MPSRADFHSSSEGVDLLGQSGDSRRVQRPGRHARSPRYAGPSFDDTVPLAPIWVPGHAPRARSRWCGLAAVALAPVHFPALHIDDDCRVAAQGRKLCELGKRSHGIMTVFIPFRPRSCLQAACSPASAPRHGQYGQFLEAPPRFRASRSFPDPGWLRCPPFPRSP